MTRHLALAAVALVGCGRAAEPPQAPAPAPALALDAAVAASPSRVLAVEFDSAALGVRKRYRAYLPAGYDDAPARRYPVIYMLHGLGDDEDGWLDGGHLAEAADAIGLQAIVVMPDGDAGFYANWARPDDPEACAAVGNPFNPRQAPASYCVATPAYEDYVVRDLVDHVDATYRTIAARRGRGIGGLSMGGFGALVLAMRHVDRFAAAASHSGVDSLLYRGPFPYEPGKGVLLDDVSQWGRALGPLGMHVRRIFGADAAVWRGHEPTLLAAKLAPGDLAIYLDCGSEDGLGLNNQAQYLHEVLTARGLAHAWYLGPGGHDFDFWSQRIDDSLGFFAGALARPE
ncbi:MAG: esterase family protein [Myxococcales bacterium]|nr:esterase family protein [Myxococcales bacterium]